MSYVISFINQMHNLVRIPEAINGILVQIFTTPHFEPYNTGIRSVILGNIDVKLFTIILYIKIRLRNFHREDFLFFPRTGSVCIISGWPRIVKAGMQTF